MTPPAKWSCNADSTRRPISSAKRQEPEPPAASAGVSHAHWNPAQHCIALRLLARLFDRRDAIHAHILERLPDAAGPANLNLFYQPVRAQSEMHPAVAGTGISDGGGDLVPLRAAVRGVMRTCAPIPMRLLLVPTRFSRIQWLSPSRRCGRTSPGHSAR